MKNLIHHADYQKKIIDIIKYNVKNRIERELPELPEVIETILFFQSSDAWLFYYNLLNKQYPIKSGGTVFLEVKVKVKKKFQQYLESQEYLFYCKIKQKQDIYNPKVSIIQKLL